MEVLRCRGGACRVGLQHEQKKLGSGATLRWWWLFTMEEGSSATRPISYGRWLDKGAQSGSQYRVAEQRKEVAGVEGLAAQ